MELFCQWFVVFWLVVGFLVCVHTDFNGREARTPKGFRGFIVSLVVNALFALLYYGAGAFSLLF